MRLKVLGVKGSTNTKAISEAIRGLSKEQAASILVTTKLDEAKQRYILTLSGVSEQEADAALKAARLAKQQQKAGISTEELKKRMISLGTALKAATPYILIGGITILSNLFSKVESDVGNKAKLITSAILGIGTVVVTVVSMSNVAIKTFMASNIIGWITLAVTALGVAIKGAVEAIDKIANASTHAKEKAIEFAKETKDSWEATKDELDDVTTELETAYKRLEELQELSDRGVITFVEQEELKKLQDTIIMLENEKALLEGIEAIKKKDAEKAASDAFFKIFEEKLSDAFVQEDNTVSKGFSRVLASIMSFGLTDAILGVGISDWSIKKTSMKEYIDDILKKMKNGGELTEQEESTLVSFYDDIGKQKDLLSYHSGDNLDQWQKDANQAYNTYWEYIHKLNIAQGKMESVWNDVLSMERFGNIKEVLTALADTGKVSSDILEDLYNSNPDFQNMVGYLTKLGLFAWNDAEKVKGLVNQISQLSEKAGSSERQANRLSESLSKYKTTIEALQRALDEYANSGSVSTEAYNQVVALNEDYADIFDFSSGKIAIASEEVDKLVDELIAEYGATLATNGATEDQIANMVSLAKSLSNTTDEVENVIEAVEDLAEVLQNSIEDNPMTTLEAWELIDKYPELANAITKTARGYTVEADAVRNLIKAKAELLRVEGVESGVVDTLLKDMENPDSLLEDVLQNQFEKIESRYSGELQELEHLTNTINNEIKALKDKGYDVPTSYYEKLGEIENQKINLLKKELTDLTEKFEKALSTNEIQEGTDEFYEMSNTINSVKEQIQESNLSLQSFSNTIRDIKWDNFNKIHEEIQKITDESEFLLELLDSKEMTDDNGNLTQFGNAALGLHGVNYNVYMEQAKRYAKEIANLEKDIANDKGNQTLIDRKKELLELQRESILAAEDEKQVMIDLVTEGIETELSAVDKLIDKYKDALDSVKDLYDYQNKITDITSEIGNLQKQIMAYGNDDSEETKAQIQKLKVELKEANEELQQTEYDQFIADQKKLLDNLYTDYETILNRRIDDVDSLIIDSVNAINTNSSDIKATLESVAGNVGNRLSDKMQSIWTTSEDIGKVVSVYSGNFDSALGSANENLGSIDDTIGDGFIEIGSDISTVGSTLSTIDGDIDNVNSSVGNVDASVDNVAGKLDGTNSELDLLLGKTDGTNIGIDNLAMRLNDLIAGLNTISSKIDATNSTISTISSKLDSIRSTIGNNSYTPPIISSGSGGAVNNGLSGSFNTNGTSNTPSGNVSTNTSTGAVNTYKTTGVLNSEDYSVSGLNNVSIGWDDCTVTIAGQEYEVATHDAEENTVSEPVKRKLNNLFGGTQPPAGTLAGLNGTVYVVSKDGSWVDFADKNKDKRSLMTEAFFKTLNKYKDGGLADYTGLAWLDGTKSKPEMVLDAEDTENFIALRDILSKLASEDVGLGNPLYSAFDPISYRGSLPNLNDKLTQVQDNHNETVVENHIDINIPIEKVEDYNDFVTKLQEDGQFEKMVQAMTIGRLNGGSSLAKYNYRWKK